MGVVYKAYDPELNRPVALKLLKTEGSDALLRDRLLREAQALARVSHPNVIAVHDVGTFASDVFLAMEYVEGPTLRAWLGARPRSVREIVNVFVAAGEGLAAAHHAGLIHRDFKPENVIVGNDGRVRVLDFGVARAAATEPVDDGALPQLPSTEASRRGGTGAPSIAVASTVDGDLSSLAGRRGAALLGTSLTRVGALVGTPTFMAPEQHGGGAVDERADQFSFCISIYHALYGVFPFEGKSLQEYRANVVSGRLRDVPARASVPRWLRKAIVRGLARAPEARYPSMAAMLSVLRADPWAARRRWIPLLAAVGVASLFAWGYREQRREQARACEGGVHKLAVVWDDARKSAVRGAFLGSGKPYAAVAWGTVERAFDGYVHQWEGMYRDACEATHVRHEQSQELLDLRMVCLADHLTQFRALGDVFAHADGSVVERASQSSQSLKPLDDCADTAALRAPVPPPANPQTRKRVDELREDVARASALSLAGKYEDGARVASGAVANAATLGYRPSEAESQFVLGDLLWKTGDFAGAARANQAAIVAAVSGHHDEYVAKAALALVNSARYRPDHFEEGHRWIAIAEAAIERLQQKEELLAAWHQNLASLLDDEGKYEAALAEFRLALEIVERVRGSENPWVAASLNNVGLLLESVGRLDEALAHHRRALAIREKVLGAEHPDVAVSLNNIGTVLSNQGRYEEALASAQRAVAVNEKALGLEHPALAYGLGSMAHVLAQLGRYEEGLACARRALAIREKALGPEDPDVAVVHDTLALLLREQGNYEESLSQARQSLAIREKRFGTEHVHLVSSHEKIAEAFLGLGKNADALRHAQSAVDLCEKNMGREHTDLVEPLHLVGEASLGLHDLANAVASLERALDLLERHQGDPREGADVRFALARAWWSAGINKERALELATQARATYGQIGRIAAKDVAAVERWLHEHATKT